MLCDIVYTKNARSEKSILRMKKGKMTQLDAFVDPPRRITVQIPLQNERNRWERKVGARLAPTIAPG